MRIFRFLTSPLSHDRAFTVVATPRVFLPLSTFLVWMALLAVGLRTRSALAWFLLGLLAVATLPALLTWLLVSARFAGALASHRVALERLAAGDYQVREVVAGDEEIGQVQRAFNAVAETAAEMQRALAEGDARAEETLLMMAGALAGATAAGQGSGRSGPRVAHFAVQIGKTLQLSPVALASLRRAALLRDIGGAASVTEAEVRHHPDRAVELLQGVPALQQELAAIRHHHERYDGRGYPLGLKGDAIPSGARILALADALDEMTSDAPALGPAAFDRAKAAILDASGSQFDPEIVTAFLKCQGRLRDHREPLPTSRLPAAPYAV